MALTHPYDGTETKAKQPINETLMDLKVRENFEGLDTRVTSLETAGTGGGGASDPKEYFADILAGGKDDVGILWRRRFSPFQSTIRNGSSKEGADFEALFKNDRMIFMEEVKDSVRVRTFAQHYNGQRLGLLKDGEVGFKLKKGENFFGLRFILESTASDNVEIKIDGQTPSSLGLVDENGDAAANAINTNGTPDRTGLGHYFFGLDGEEHIVTILNNDSASKEAGFIYFEVGHKTPTPSIDHTINIEAGKARIAGTEIAFAEGSHTFAEPAKGNANGNTSMLKINTSGTISAVDGQSPAMTQVKSEESVAFSGAVTSLPVKNNWYFPANGIAMLSTGFGEHHIFSYNGKTDASVQAMTLDNILWQSKPTKDMVSGNIVAGAAGDNTPSLNINLWGSAPILVDGTNNKIDFQITVNGITTLHAATIANGRYAADLLPFGKAVVDAMKAVKTITGEYFCEYNPQSQLWSIGVRGKEETRIDFLNSSGVNAPNTFGSIIGITTDVTTKTSYTSTTEVQHLCSKIFQADQRFIPTEDSKFKYNFGYSDPTYTQSDDIIERLGFSSVRERIGTGDLSIIEFYPDVDCCGVSLMFANVIDGTTMSAQVDNGELIYGLQTETAEAENGQFNRASIRSIFLSFPKGSKVVKVYTETSAEFKISASSNDQVIFVGGRQYFTKPKWEELSNTEKILKTYEIAPISLIATDYGNQASSLYSPAGSNDNIDTITESGTWASTTWQAFNRYTRDTTTANSYVDIAFTLQGDGGGAALRTAFYNSVGSQSVKYYLNTQAAGINEANDLIGSVSLFKSNNVFDLFMPMVMGLPADSYILRVKMHDAQRLINSGYRIIDTVAPEENNYTNADVSNNFQAVSFPFHTIRRNIAQDNGNIVADYLLQTGFKEGKDIHTDYAIANLSFGQEQDTGSLNDFSSVFYSQARYDNNNDKLRAFDFCRSAMITSDFWHVSSNSSTPFADGRQTPTNHNHQTQTKGGTAPNAARRSHSAAVVKRFALACSFSSGSTYTIADTRGLKDGMTVVLYDGTNYETFTIENIVVDTSFDIKQTPATIVPASVTRVRFYGFHSLIIRNNNNAEAYITDFAFEPLPIRPSMLKAIVSRKTKLENTVINFREVSNGDDLYYPYHSDGVQADWSTSSVSVISKSSGSATFGINQDLKDINVSAGNLDIQVKSTKEVYEELDNSEVF